MHGAVNQKYLQHSGDRGGSVWSLNLHGRDGKHLHVYGLYESVNAARLCVFVGACVRSCARACVNGR